MRRLLETARAPPKRAPTPPNTEESESETEEADGEEDGKKDGVVWQPPAPPCSPDLRKRPVGAGPGSEAT